MSPTMTGKNIAKLPTAMPPSATAAQDLISSDGAAKAVKRVGSKAESPCKSTVLPSSPNASSENTIRPSPESGKASVSKSVCATPGTSAGPSDATAANVYVLACER